MRGAAGPTSFAFRQIALCFAVLISTSKNISCSCKHARIISMQINSVFSNCSSQCSWFLCVQTVGVIAVVGFGLTSRGP